MSLKRMITKLALAFAAKKGVEMFRNVGGMSGMRTAMQGQQSQSQTSQTQQASSGGGLMDLLGGSGQSGGLGAILGSLGLGGAQQEPQERTTDANATGGSLGSIIGALSGVMNGQQPVTDAGRDLDAQFSTSDAATDADSRPVLRAMVQMARADGSVEADEQTALLEILNDASADERATLQTAMSEPVDPAKLASDTPHHVAKEAYSAALLIGSPDNPAEASFLRTFAQGLRLQQADVDAIHSAMAKPHLMV